MTTFPVMFVWCLERREDHPTFLLNCGEGGWLVGLYTPVEKLAVGLPGLVGTLEIDNVGHWVQHEASAEVSDQIVKFLRTVNPCPSPK